MAFNLHTLCVVLSILLYIEPIKYAVFGRSTEVFVIIFQKRFFMIKPSSVADFVWNYIILILLYIVENFNCFSIRYITVLTSVLLLYYVVLIAVRVDIEHILLLSQNWCHIIVPTAYLFKVIPNIYI